ncbi:MAG: HNH endonuclease family protein [Micrococcales bacterium]|nr:HNH endonuclease family protein [Micrococcales bacterium]
MRWWPWVVLVVCVVVGVGFPRWSAARDAGDYPVSASDLAHARAVLDQLGVERPRRVPGYERARFGPAWADVDANGCDTRNDILARDLTNIDTKDGCVVLRGTLHDPYTGRHIEFVRGPGSADVQIDHVVALADAWAKGADRWDSTRRLAFANDPANLLAVSGPANQEKGSSDAAGWLPQRSYRCVYVLLQVRVKDAYGLSVTPQEKSAVSRALKGCHTAPAPADAAPSPASSPGTPQGHLRRRHRGSAGRGCTCTVSCECHGSAKTPKAPPRPARLAR